jgi:hypothetical protein
VISSSIFGGISGRLYINAVLRTAAKYCAGMVNGGAQRRVDS